MAHTSHLLHTCETMSDMWMEYLKVIGILQGHPFTG